MTFATPNDCLIDEYNAFREKYNITLNEQQEQAVRAVEGANLLLAVPGSGKTTVLVARLGFMITYKGINPKNILAMTYTKAATVDMRERFSSMFGEELSNKMEFRTINGIADITIKRYAQKTGRPAFELISDEKKRLAIIRGILQKNQEEFPAENEVIEASTIITYIKNMMLNNEEISQLKTNIDGIDKIYQMYKEQLIEKRLMDYDDQLVYAYSILRKNPDILSMFHNRFHYICVDEAQDTSKIQHEIIRLLAMKGNNIFMVGDEDQSIYAFRAAYPKALMSFKTDYPNAQVFYMEKNYRSTSDIVNKAASFIEKNRGRYNKKIVSHRGHGTPVRRINVRNRGEQYRFLLGVAKGLRNETAVLYRDNDTAIPLIDLLLRNNVPFKAMRVKGLFFTNKVVFDIQSFLKFALDPKDEDAFMQIYYKCGYGFNKETAKWACARARREGISILDALIKQVSEWKHLKKKAVEFKNYITDIGRKLGISHQLSRVNAVRRRGLLPC